MQTTAASTSSAAAAPVDDRPSTPPLQQAVRVRALYTYAPSNPTELAFEAGQSIKVIGRTYDQWWRGTLAGRVGIFPVNYVEPLPAPSAAELRLEREEEDELFERIAGFDELLERLRAVEPGRPIPDDVEELYAGCVGLQVKLGGLISKYAGAKAELETLSNIFAQAAFSYQAMKNPHVAPPAPQSATLSVCLWLPSRDLADLRALCRIFALRSASVRPSASVCPAAPAAASAGPTRPTAAAAIAAVRG